MTEFFSHVPDTTIDEVDDKSSAGEMDLEYTAKAYGQLIVLANTFTPITEDIKHEEMMEEDLETDTPQKSIPFQKYKKYGEDQIKRFFDLMSEEGIKVPEAAEKTGIPRSTAYGLKKVWNDSDGTAYPKGCKKRESKKKAGALPGNTKLGEQHTLFLIGLIDENPCITVVAAKKDLCFHG